MRRRRRTRIEIDILCVLCASCEIYVDLRNVFGHLNANKSPTSPIVCDFPWNLLISEKWNRIEQYQNVIQRIWKNFGRILAKKKREEEFLN
jgi:hypothetical protein